MHPNDRKRVARLTELTRAGIAPHSSSEGLWTQQLHRPTLLVGLTTDSEDLRARIDARVDEMIRLGAEKEVREAAAAGASRTARMAIGFEELLRGDAEAMKRSQWRFAKRQLTWMRKMPHVETIDRGGASDDEVASRIVPMLG